MLQMHYFSLEKIICGCILKTPKNCADAQLLEYLGDLTHLLLQMEGKEGSQDLFLPVETQVAEL